MSKSIPEFLKNILTLKNASDAAISIMRSFLGPNTLGHVDPALANSKKSERENAISLLQYIKDHRKQHLSVKTDILNDFTKMDEALDF